MLDLKRIREDSEAVGAALARRDPQLRERLAEVLERDRSWRTATTEAERLRAQQRERSEAIAQSRRAGEDVAGRLEELKQMSARVKQLGEEARASQERLQATLALLPNVPAPDAAPGPEDEVVREVGEPPQLPFTPRDHLELAGELIDTERAAKLSGARFAYLRGELVTLELALVGWALQKLRGHGFEAVIPPVLVRERALYGTGFLPDTEQQLYRLADDELYLTGTSEVALASLHDGEIIDAERLPLRYAGFSPCFRREAGAAGKDTRGIFRVHQFDKVEMFSFCRPDQAQAEHRRLLAMEEEMLAKVEVPYRVIDVAAGDLGSSAARKFDCEAWIPSQGRYREVTSTSNCTTFQARRLAIRYRGADGRPHAAATLNGTLATTRWLIPILENHQQPDGSVRVPKALQPYLGGRDVLEPGR